MKIYVESHTHLATQDTLIGGVYHSIEAFEKHKEDHWNGSCVWKLSQDVIGQAGLDFRTYFMTITNNLNSESSKYYICVQGYEVEKE